MLIVKRAGFIIYILVFFFMFSLFASQSHAAENHDELLVYIGDSLMKVKEGDTEAVAENMESFEKEWKVIKKADSAKAKAVDKTLLQVKNDLMNDTAPSEIHSLLSKLSKAVIQYDSEQNPADQKREKQQLKKLLPLIDTLHTSVDTGDIPGAKSQYSQLLQTWTSAEKVVRTESVASYGKIEKQMALIRIAITQNPADRQKAKENLKELRISINEFLSGNINKKNEKSSYTLGDVTSRLTQSAQDIEKGRMKESAEKLDEILSIWPMVEGEVSTRDSKLYTDVETKIPTAMGLLESKKADAESAKMILENLNTRLLPLTEKTSYSFWDAMLILLREGLEALLIVATLISFLKKVNQADKQKWIWFGVGAGLLSGAILAVIINIVFSQITAASNREYIEGITGIAAVIMMLTVGAWLHNKSNIQSWNRYINKQLGEALAAGNLVSFAVISFLSIFREGAETIIFYAGMAPYMSLKELLTGIVLAAVLLIFIGFGMIKYSVKIPLSLFFRSAIILIYTITFKILGISIHSLQVSQKISTHTIQHAPFIDWLGLYPTWETLIPQIILLLIIIMTSLWIYKKNSTESANAVTP
ncbi:high-affinity iron transporter [Peribacillus deserti]|uniref:High-affinity iron transporter n=1 Tax=Peribacillus deserti TaxID=673318 RepID=A0ABS2QEU6_9BACI|nr:FTR1 family protein [Peribacillus deserti]MBM7691510.1 high-affinity iron transporter [Peribacillus deserti]